MKLTDIFLILVASCMVLGSVAIVCGPSGSSGNVPGGPGVPRIPTDLVTGSRVALEDFLPLNPVQDASVDYREYVQEAIDAAAGGALILPPFPVLVTATPGQNWCVRVTQPMTIEGSNGSAIVERAGAVQILRAEDVDGLTLKDFHVHGVDAGGQGLAHGLVQVTGGHNVSIARLHVTGSDADGIAVSTVEGLRITDCLVENASKAALYASNCRGVVMRGNIARSFGGHRTAAGNVVGSGIQLSSNCDVICSGNVLDRGTGVGILCNALTGGAAPVGTILEGNRIQGVRNSANINTSSGIRLANSHADKFTQTVVRGNSIHGCGAYGVYVENHHGALVQGNSIASSVKSGVLVSSGRDVLISQNMILNSGISGESGLAQILLINNADRTLVRENTLLQSPSAEAATAANVAVDSSQGSANVLEPRRTAGRTAPQSGRWNQGDLVFSTTPGSGAWAWICTVSGTPGSWLALTQP